VWSKQSVLKAATASLFLIAVSPGAAWAAEAQTRAPDQPIATAKDPSDPWERLNRRVYKFDENMDKRLIHPAAKGYERALPAFLRNGVRNFVNNLGEPVTALNDILQIRPKAAATTTIRFVANSTVGVGGLFDVATKTGLTGHTNGFANTLGRCGRIGPGPYVYLPLFGPSTVRDAIGAGVDGVMSPFTFVRFAGRATIRLGVTAAGGVDTRARAAPQLETLNSTAADPYATLRSVYLQNRKAEIKGEAAGLEPLPDFDEPASPKPSGTAQDSTTDVVAAHTAPLMEDFSPDT
jgi:phospholipid-binding lipoprotein MlaA